jgi:hypothetical protein
MKIPTFLHLCEYLMLKERSKNSSVVLNEQNRQASVESGLVRYPPAREMYGSMYCEHVKPEGGLMVAYSTSAQVISCPPIPVLPRVEQTMAETVRTRERLTVAHQRFDEVRVRGEVIHPPPPSELSERLQDTIAVPNPINNREA